MLRSVSLLALSLALALALATLVTTSGCIADYTLACADDRDCPSARRCGPHGACEPAFVEGLTRTPSELDVPNRGLTRPTLDRDPRDPPEPNPDSDGEPDPDLGGGSGDLTREPV